MAKAKTRKSAVSSVLHVTFANARFSAERVESALRGAEQDLAKNGALSSGAELLRLDLDKNGYVTDCFLDDQDGVAKLAAKSLTRTARKAKITVRTAKTAHLLKS